MDIDAGSELVSVCIPTCDRPERLREALESCFAQTYQNFEVIVGDDSRSSASELVAAEFHARFPGKIRYQRNLSRLGQAENVNSLFRLAAGSRLVLLHDDDLLLPTALQDLADCWNQTPALSAAFGKQYITNMNGEILLKESEQLNLNYRRTAETAGAVVPGLAGIVRMFPNDGYMVLTERARAIGLLPASQVGAACDFDFGLRYCADNGNVWFLNSYTSAYRISDDAISKTSITAPFMFRALREYRAKKINELMPEIRQALQEEIESAAPRAVSGHARMGEGLQALSILFSPDYGLRNRMRLKFLFQVAVTFVALVAGVRGVQVVLRARDGIRHLSRLPQVTG